MAENCDPHCDPHGEMSGRKQWNKQAATSSFLNKKTPQSLIQHGLEGSTAVGKDEVGSSNLPSSSKKHRKLRFSVLFCCKNVENSVGQLPDPHPDPHAEIRGKSERAPERKFGFLSGVFIIFGFYITCAMKLPMDCAASSCFCLVAWV